MAKPHHLPVKQLDNDPMKHLCRPEIWPKLAEYNHLDAMKRGDWLAEQGIAIADEELLRAVTKSHFVIPNETRHECQRCGECCRYARKVATFTYEPCLFLNDKNECSKHSGRYHVCKWFPFWLFNAGDWGPLLTIKPYCKGYGHGKVVDYFATVKHLCELAQAEETHADGASVIHEVVYLPKTGEWDFPSRANVDSLIAVMSEAAVQSAKLHRDAQDIDHPGQLHYAQHYTSGLLGTTAEPQVTVNEAGIVTDLNQGFLDVCRSTRQAIVGKPLFDVFSLPEQLKKDLRQCFANGRLTGAAHKLVPAEGTRVSLLVNGLIFRDRSDGLVHEALLGFSRISDVVYSELTQSRNYARGLLEACLDALLVVGVDGVVTDINEAVVALSGKDRDAVLGARFDTFFDSPEAARKGVERTIAEGSVRDYQLTWLSASGTKIPVSFNASLFRDPEGAVQGIFAIARELRA